MPTIDSPAEAQALARLIQQGRFTGAARDNAMQALRTFDSSGAQPPAAASSAPPDAPRGALGEVALAGRNIGEGVLDTLALPMDASTAVTNFVNRASNRFLGTHRPIYPYFSGKLSDALTQAGAPVAATPGERLSSSIIRGTAGALTGAGVLGALGGTSSLPNAIRAGTAGATGGASSDIARQAGAGPLGQSIAAMAGGLTPAALEGGALGISRLGGMVRPFTRAGQAQLAANTLTRNVSNPTQAAINLSNAAPLVPGSLRTAGEASGDPGMLALEKGVRARNSGAFAERISQQNAARQAALTKLGGTQADIENAEAARDATTAPMREGAFATGMGVVPAPMGDVQATIDRILKSPAGARESVSKTLNWARGLIGDHSDPETLYEVRKDLALAQRGKLQPSSPDAPNASTLAQARGQLGDVIGSLDDAIEAVAPGYKGYLAKYRDMSAPIDQMGTIQELQQRASSGLDTATGQPFLSGPLFSRQLQGELGRTGPGATRFTPAQVRGLQAVQEDLQRGNALSSPTVRAPGSDTFQNFMLSQRLRGIGNFASHIPILGKALKAGGEFVDQRVNAELSRAMLDPAYAAKLLRQGTLPKSVGPTVRSLLAPYLTGGALSSPYPALESR